MSLTVFHAEGSVCFHAFSPGFLFWCMLFGLGFLLDQKEQGRYPEVVAISASNIGFPDIFTGTDLSGTLCGVLVGAGAVAYGTNLCYT